jgi:hypothetical protein
VHDLERVNECLVRIANSLDSGIADEVLVSACTWQVVVLYARCFESVSNGRRAALGDAAVRTLTTDERSLHDGWLDLRNTRFAHVGIEAKHKAIVALLPNGELTVLYEIEVPAGIADREQLTLGMGLVAKVFTFAQSQRDDLRQRVLAELRATDVSGPITTRIRQERRQVQPEAIALQLMKTLGLWKES